jgi:hypothetical protein
MLKKLLPLAALIMAGLFAAYKVKSRPSDDLWKQATTD